MKCLIVEDDVELSVMLKDCLGNLGHQSTTVRTVSAAMEILQSDSFDLLMLDFNLPDGNTLALSDLAAVRCPSSRVIMLTGAEVFPNGENLFIAPGIDWILRKPVMLNDLCALIDYAETIVKQPVRGSAFGT